MKIFKSLKLSEVKLGVNMDLQCMYVSCWNLRVRGKIKFK